MKIKGLFILLLMATLLSGSFAFAQENEARAWLGIAFAESADGVVISEVIADSPAEEAGLQVDDVIVNVDGEAVENGDDLRQRVRDSEPGDTMTLGIERAAESLEIEVTLGERPDGENIPPIITQQTPGNFMMMFGVLINQTDEGWEVIEVVPAMESELQTGDVVTAINGNPVSEMEIGDMLEFMRGMSETVELTVLRDGEEMIITVERPNIMPIVPGTGNIPGRGERIVLGVQFQMLDEEIAAENDLEIQEGALVNEVLPGFPADEAGVEAGDVILKVDETEVTADNPLNEVIADYESGDTVTLQVLRDGETLDIEVTLAEREFALPDEIEIVPAIPFLNNLEDLDRLLDELEANIPAEGGSASIECRDDGVVVFSVQVAIDENQNVTGSFSAPDFSVDKLRNLDFAALDCQVVGE